MVTSCKLMVEERNLSHHQKRPEILQTQTKPPSPCLREHSSFKPQASGATWIPSFVTASNSRPTWHGAPWRVFVRPLLKFVPSCFMTQFFQRNSCLRPQCNYLMRLLVQHIILSQLVDSFLFLFWALAKLLDGPSFGIARHFRKR